MNWPQSGPYVVGIDVGTSGCRMIAVSIAGEPLAQAQAPLPPSRLRDGLLCQDPADWWSAICQCFEQLRAAVSLLGVQALVVDSTSGTLLLADALGAPMTCGIMYNDQRPPEIAERIAAVAGPCTAASVSSSLAKLVWLQQASQASEARFALHAADWISGRLCGKFGYSDDHNALKTGFDPVNRCWPGWLDELGLDRALLPLVNKPGSRLGLLDPTLAKDFSLGTATRVLQGTTDSVAAFLASGAEHPGDAVTVLGTTLVIKVLSTVPIQAPEFGVYSHRLGPYWVVGGASNSGGAALRRYFSLAEIQSLSAALDPVEESALNYYPLPAIGERFPVADPALVSQVNPQPEDRRAFLHGLLEGIARIEKRSYDLLASLGAEPVERIFSVGGGAANPAWTAIRQRVLNVELAAPVHIQSAYGAALLALPRS